MKFYNNKAEEALQAAKALKASMFTFSILAVK
jgi:hypothetical protein